MNDWFITENNNWQRMDDDLFAYVAPVIKRIETEHLLFYKDSWSYFVFINNVIGTFGTYIGPTDKVYDDPGDAMKAADAAIANAFSRLAIGDEDDTLEDVQTEAGYDRRV